MGIQQTRSSALMLMLMEKMVKINQSGDWGVKVVSDSLQYREERTFSHEVSLDLVRFVKQEETILSSIKSDHQPAEIQKRSQTAYILLFRDSG